MKNSMKKIIAILAVIAIVVCAFAACTKTETKDETTAAAESTQESTSAEETAEDDTTAAESAQESTSAEETAEGDTTAKTSSDKKWVIATDTVFKPFEYRDANDNLIGIDVDILAAVAEDQGFEYELNSLGWDAAIAACQAGQADGMIAGASITEERQQKGWTFSDSYFTATQCAVAKAGSSIKALADIKDAKVAVKTGTQGATYAESLEKEYNLTLTYFEDSPTMYQAVEGGQCDVCFEDTPIIKAQIADGTVALEVIEDSENDGAGYGFAIFNADNQELVDMFNAGLKNIKDNGKYDEIIAKYLGK